MAISATHHAFVHFRAELLQRRPAENHPADCGKFRAAYMIKVQDQDVAFMAVHTWMFHQMLKNDAAISFRIT